MKNPVSTLFLVCSCGTFMNSVHFILTGGSSCLNPWTFFSALHIRCNLNIFLLLLWCEILEPIPYAICSICRLHFRFRELLSGENKPPAEIWNKLNWIPSQFYPFWKALDKLPYFFFSHKWNKSASLSPPRRI